MFSSATKSGTSSSSYNITKSLRFRSSASAYITRTPSVAGNRQKWTLSFWVKRGTTAAQILFGTLDSAGTTGSQLNLQGNGTFLWQDNSASGANMVTTQVFRDPASWYHIVIGYDTTQATASNRFKLYVNGSQVTSFTTATYQTLNYSGGTNSTTTVSIGRSGVYNSAYFDGYLCEFNFIDGQQLDASSFGSTNATTGVWQPKAYTGTYGTQGYYLQFTNTTSTSTLGNDSSGNGNNFTVNNISLTTGINYDSMNDVPTLGSGTISNYCVLNPLALPTATISNGNLYGTGTGTSAGAVGTLTVNSGKWYIECTAITVQTTVTNTIFGFQSLDTVGTAVPIRATGSVGYDSTGSKWIDNTSSAYGATFTNNDVIGIAVNLDGGSITFYKNNVSQGTISYTFSNYKNWTFGCGAGGGAATRTYSINFGQRPFVYTPPSGYSSLNTFNLPNPAVPKGNTEMDATLYTGTGSALSVTNAGSFKPDLVWAKSRSNAIDHYEYDSVRGINQYLSPNLTAAEGTAALGGVTAFNSNGFSLGTAAGTNTSAATYVAWQWQAGQGTTSTNTSGSITSTVSVNPIAGFSIVTYTGNAVSNATVGHGLGVTPAMVIVKNRASAIVGNWRLNHKSLPAAYNLALDLTNAQFALSSGSGGGVGTLNNSATFTLANGTTDNANVNQNGVTYVAYCWSEIDGFSKFGGYSGNSATDGPFVYTGFRPKYLLIKRVDSAGNWLIFDSARDTFNLTQNFIWSNGANANQTSADVGLDFLSNGFKIRQTSTNINAGNLIYVAFAENPFKYALAR